MYLFHIIFLPKPALITTVKTTVSYNCQNKNFLQQSKQQFLRVGELGGSEVGGPSWEPYDFKPCMPLVYQAWL